MYSFILFILFYFLLWLCIRPKTECRYEERTVVYHCLHRAWKHFRRIEIQVTPLRWRGEISISKLPAVSSTQAGSTHNTPLSNALKVVFLTFSLCRNQEKSQGMRQQMNLPNMDQENSSWTWRTDRHKGCNATHFHKSDLLFARPMAKDRASTTKWSMVNGLRHHRQPVSEMA